MSKRVVSKEEKMRDIAEARELYIEAGKLIAKANKLIKKNARKKRITERIRHGLIKEDVMGQRSQIVMRGEE